MGIIIKGERVIYEIVSVIYGTDRKHEYTRRKFCIAGRW